CVFRTVFAAAFCARNTAPKLALSGSGRSRRKISAVLSIACSVTRSSFAESTLLSPLTPSGATGGLSISVVALCCRSAGSVGPAVCSPRHMAMNSSASIGMASRSGFHARQERGQVIGAQQRFLAELDRPQLAALDQPVQAGTANRQEGKSLGDRVGCFGEAEGARVRGGDGGLRFATGPRSLWTWTVGDAGDVAEGVGRHGHRSVLMR